MAEKGGEKKRPETRLWDIFQLMADQAPPESLLTTRLPNVDEYQSKKIAITSVYVLSYHKKQ